MDDAGTTRYSSRVLVGNWNEEHIAHKQKCKAFTDARNKTELRIQRSSRLFDVFLEPTKLDAPNDYIRFGAKVQLCAVDMPKSEQFPKQPLVMSLSIDANTIQSEQSIGPHCDVTMGPAIRPYARNTFIIQRYIPAVVCVHNYVS